MRHALKVRRPRLLEAGRVSFLALSLMLFCVLFATTPAFADYRPLYPHYFPEQGSTESSFAPYKKLAVDGISDSSTFSIYVPSGIKTIQLIIDVGAGTGHVLVGRFGSEPTKTYSSAVNLTVSEPRAKLSDFMDVDFVAKLGSDRSMIIEDYSPSLSTGGWIYFKLYKYDGSSLSPRAYSSYYVVDPALYFPPPEGYVPPSSPSDDGSSDGVTDPVQPTSPPSSDGTSPPNPFAGVILEPRSNILDPLDNATENPDTPPDDNSPDASDPGAETPDTQPVRLPARGKEKPLTLEPVHCAEVDQTNFLQPVIEVNPELLPADTQDEGGEVAHADAYAIFTVDESVYMVVSDILGNLTVFPFNELAFDSYGTAAINLADGTCECNAFKTVQDFLVAENIGPENLAQWHEDGTEVVFYFGIVPNGDWDYYQGTAFQIVK